MKEIKKFGENGGYEYYEGGSHRDAAEVQQRLRDERGLEGTLVLRGVHGWCVRVSRQKEAV